MISTIQMQNAVQEYVEKRAQMGPLKAAAHVCQSYGCTARELMLALQDEHLLMVQMSNIDEVEAEEVVA